MFLAALVTFALLYDAQPLLPELSRSFGVPPASATLTVSLTSAALAIALVFAGPSSEHFGRRPVILVSLYTSAIVSVINGLVPNWELLLAARFLQGITLAGLPAVGLAYLVEEVRAEHSARAAGVYIAGTALGGMFGRLGAGVTAHYWGWRGTLISIGICALLLAFAVTALLPHQRGFSSTESGIRILWRNTKTVLTEPGLICLYLIGACGMGCFVGMFNVIGYRLDSPPYSLPTWANALIFLIYPIGSVASVLAGRLTTRWDRWRVTLLGAGLSIVGTSLTLASPLWIVIIGLALFTAGFFASHGVASGWVALRARNGIGATGQASSSYSVFYYLGGSIFGTVAGLVWTNGHWLAVVGLCCFLSVVAASSALILKDIPPATRKNP